MIRYCFAGQGFCFPYPIPELEYLEIQNGAALLAAPCVPPSLLKNESGATLPFPAPIALSGQTVGWVAGANRQVETWSAPPGILLKVTGGSDFYISPGGQDILCSQVYEGEMLNETDRQILLGPVIVLALVLRGTWCLHASAAIFNNSLIVFLGESGQGKSTLAAYLAAEGKPEWQLAADDILPVMMAADGVKAKPRFPQLKLPMDAQPGVHMPESLPLDRICVLMQADRDDQPGLQLLPPNQAAQVLVSHTAGTRLFDRSLLSEHLAFCARAAKQVPVYRLAYPHRRDTLPAIKASLEELC